MSRAGVAVSRSSTACALARARPAFFAAYKALSAACTRSFAKQRADARSTRRWPTETGIQRALSASQLAMPMLTVTCAAVADPACAMASASTMARDEDHRHVGQLAVRLEGFADQEPAHTGHLRVEQDQVGDGLARHAQRVLAADGEREVGDVRQDARQNPNGAGVVVNQEDVVIHANPRHRSIAAAQS
jgi:hypothetical protein